MARHFRLPMPEAGAEREAVMAVHHNCPGSVELKQATGDPDIDLVIFPIGLQGWEMPANVPFEVTTSNTCGVCGKALRAWAEWVAPKLWTP